MPAICDTLRAAAADPSTRPSAAEIAALVAPRVAALRGLSFRQPVPIEIVDEDAAVAHLLGRIERFQPRAELDRTYRTYELLGLLPSGFDLLGAVAEWVRGDVGGFYDPESSTFFVLDRVSAGSGPLVIAHELTHALEDQHFDLDARMRAVMHDDDRMLAQAAVREGSAVLLMNAFAAESEGEVGDARIEFDDVGGPGASDVDPMDTLPLVIRRQLLAPYVVGPRFLARGGGDGATASGYPIESVNRAWHDPPRSTEQILHPEKYWQEATRDEPRPVDLNDAGDALGRGWKRTMQGTLGELTLGALVEARTPEWPSSAAAGFSGLASSGWDGDRWELWERETSAAVLLGTLWDSPRDAQEFVDALPADGRLRWRVRGDAVALVAGVSGRPADRALRRMLARLSADLVSDP